MTQIVQSYRNAFAVTPSATDLAQPVDALYVGGAGNLVFTATGGAAAVTLTGVPAGSLIRCEMKNVGTGSTVTSLIGFAYE